jgi:hypothetical protein
MSQVADAGCDGPNMPARFSTLVFEPRLESGRIASVSIADALDFKLAIGLFV